MTIDLLLVILVTSYIQSKQNLFMLVEYLFCRRDLLPLRKGTMEAVGDMVLEVKLTDRSVFQLGTVQNSNRRSLLPRIVQRRNQPVAILSSHFGHG